MSDTPARTTEERHKEELQGFVDSEMSKLRKENDALARELEEAREAADYWRGVAETEGARANRALAHHPEEGD